MNNHYYENKTVIDKTCFKNLLKKGEMINL